MACGFSQSVSYGYREHDVPLSSRLPLVQKIEVVKSVVPPGLQDYATDVDVESDGLIFNDLSEWDAKVAIGASGVHTSCLGADVGSPPRSTPSQSILSKAEEIRLSNMPERIEVSRES